MTQKEIKIKIAKAHREEIINSIKAILKDEDSYMTVKTAMNVFINVRVNEPERFLIPMGLQRVRKAARKAVRKSTYNPFISDAARRQMPSSMRK